jgi:hypothetical protein
MIQHAKAFNIANIASLPSPADIDDDDIFALDDPVEEEVFEAEFDDTLDHLMKHAMKSTSATPDNGRVWQQLSRRVQGPFGFAALEAPALNSIEAELLTSGGRVQQAPFVLNDKVTERSRDQGREQRGAVDCLWDMLRFGASGRTLGSSVGILG